MGESESRFSLQKRPELWVRARSLGDPSEALLFDQIKPQDISDLARSGKRKDDKLFGEMFLFWLSHRVLWFCKKGQIYIDIVYSFFVALLLFANDLDFMFDDDLVCNCYLLRLAFVLLSYTSLFVNDVY